MDTIRSGKPKNPNLFENAHAISRLFYCWGAPLLMEGSKRELTDDDVCEPMSCHRSSHCEEMTTKAWEEELKKCKRSGANPQLARVIMRLFGPKYALLCVIITIKEITPFVQVYFLFGLLDYFSHPLESRKFADALWSALGIIFCTSVRVFFEHLWTIRAGLLGVNARLAVTTLLYQKVLRLSKAKKSNISTGFVINLFAIDAKKLDNTFQMLIYLVIGPLQIIAAAIIMWFVFGWATIPGTIFSMLCVPLQLWFSKKCSITRHNVVKKADIRVRIMNEIISGIKVLKMYAWENAFAEMIFAARKEELKCTRDALRYRTAGAMTLIYRSRTAVFLVLLSYVLSKGDINSLTVYLTIVLFNTYQVPVSQMMTKGCLYTGESLISLERMTKFLLSDEDGDDDGQIDEKPSETGDGLNILEPLLQLNHDAAISIRGLTATWSEDAVDPILNDINLDFPRGKLTAVVGVVGSGKSSLLQAIMGEMAVKKGSICFSGSISYAAQEPWVFQGSVRDNIVFGQEFNPERYNKVIQVCALNKDIAMFPNGDLTIAGERGVMLSGGQKARVGLARAVYRKADMYLLDDPLSAVDVNVGKLIFDECITGVLEGKTVILVTHQLQLLESVIGTVLLENGTVKSIGCYSDLEGIGHDITKEKSERNKMCSFTTEEDDEIEKTDLQDIKPSMAPEYKMFGIVSGTPWIYLRSRGSIWAIMLLFFIFVFTQMSASFYDFWQNQWVELEDHVRRSDSTLRSHNISEGPQITLLYNTGSTTESSLIVLGVILLVMIVSALCEVLYCAQFCARVSLTIHDKMFNAVIRTSMHFFNSNTSGRILNRFSQELSIVDEIVSELLMENLVVGLFHIGTFVMVVIVNPFMIAIIAVCILVLVALKTFYARTSAQIKKLESASRSPVIAHVNQTLNGLTTIRAFGAQNFLTSEFHKHQDHNSGAQFLFIGLTRTLGFWVDCINLVYSSIVVMSFLVLDTGAANVGLAVTQVVSMASLLQFFVRLIVDLENALTSVERTTEYSNLPSEVNWEPESAPGKDIGATWPDEGKISLVDVSFRYQKNGPKVLENLNFTVMPKEKIGIVGRTGAGKSSLISALFRMAEVEGRIEIDDVDTSTISLHTLRSRISVIPQDPVLFSGTLRKNIDPFDEYMDDKLWTALEEVELKEVISNLPKGLETDISEGGGNLSVGQKQLVCLARAIVLNNKILILDEATANVDHETDALIQKTIRKKFSDNTVLTVAHRLNTVMESDKILVISNGNAVEFDHPHELLQNEIGHLRKMVAKCGKITESAFRTVAEENYKRKNLDERL